MLANVYIFLPALLKKRKILKIAASLRNYERKQRDHHVELPSTVEEGFEFFPVSKYVAEDKKAKKGNATANL